MFRFVVLPCFDLGLTVPMYIFKMYIDSLMFHCKIHFIGILAGTWPCGIVTFLSELLLEESKTQVYGAVHSFYYLSHQQHQI